jgi:type III restriction enzyme
LQLEGASRNFQIQPQPSSQENVNNVREVVGSRDYQYDAIKQIMIYLWGGSYKSITELGKENYKQKLQIQQRFGTEENFLHQLPLPDRLSGVVHMATGTGKSYVIFAIAYSFPCYGVY